MAVLEVVKAWAGGRKTTEMTVAGVGKGRGGLKSRRLSIPSLFPNPSQSPVESSEPPPISRGTGTSRGSKCMRSLSLIHLKDFSSTSLYLVSSPFGMPNWAQMVPLITYAFFFSSLES